MTKEEQKALIAIYNILPEYWAVWRNSFMEWSVGIVGDVCQDFIVQTSAEEVGTLFEILEYVKNNFKHGH